ncbi:hypothetical protein HK23_05850 [Acetobacter malorum]|uniref:Uncharacterized protein n=1 Tax=Acetobacter malorum TaxID=178901 RepID=A0A1Y3G4M1_9PROT|nr:hypothetical protein HK23_05850 [Acetobacter malorum]
MSRGPMPDGVGGTEAVGRVRRGSWRGGRVPEGGWRENGDWRWNWGVACGTKEDAWAAVNGGCAGAERSAEGWRGENQRERNEGRGTGRALRNRGAQRKVYGGGITTGLGSGTRSLFVGYE